MLVPAVGRIAVALKPAPLRVTPAGTTNGHISSYSPAEILIISPSVAWDSACLMVLNGWFMLLPDSVSEPLSET